MSAKVTEIGNLSIRRIEQKRSYGEYNPVLCAACEGEAVARIEAMFRKGSIPLCEDCIDQVCDDLQSFKKQGREICPSKTKRI